ncbi:type II toxin-antitoxin system RnlA family toxin [Paenibacillus sp. PAMC 26794]|uniref:type II toxin-antitoxin system RnlA family toxin n=1 Tax=Paenibacillus sp. PAMC 26794 TaxID=1257080 RepID=UPI0002D45C15|nr:type II toxin-antitoxin system RnlA family toxin [Paenibacillus sp. PAMC 26794]
MFRNLNLNRDKIHCSIDKFLRVKGLICTLAPFESFGGTRRRLYISGECDTYIDFQFLSKGGTSIDLSSGKSNEFKEELANFIKEDPECSMGTSNNQWFVVKNIEEDDFLAVIELLKISEYTRDYCNHTDGSFRFTGIYDENLVIHRYQTKTVMIQGRPLLLYNEAVVCITELIDLDELPKTFNDNYKVDVKKSDVEAQYEYYFPLSYDKHGNKFKKILHQGIYNLQLHGDMFEYSHLLFPALRAVEGHLKIALYSYNIPLGPNSSFNMFKRDPTRGRYRLDEDYSNQINNTHKVGNLEDAYNFYQNQRHKLFHWADQNIHYDDTRIIENLGEAKGLIKDAFSIIDLYYTV